VRLLDLGGGVLGVGLEEMLGLEGGDAR
jgi:hypothetical protein